MRTVWDELMEADKIAVAHHRFDDALGFANARAEHRHHQQRVRRHDVNGQTYWAIQDALTPTETADREAAHR